MSPDITWYPVNIENLIVHAMQGYDLASYNIISETGQLSVMTQIVVSLSER